MRATSRAKAHLGPSVVNSKGGKRRQMPSSSRTAWACPTITADAEKRGRGSTQCEPSARAPTFPTMTVRPLALKDSSNAVSVAGDCGSESRTSRPMTRAPLLAILLTSLPKSSRDQGQRPYCRRLSSSIRTSTTAERWVGGGARRKYVSVIRNSESRITGTSERRETITSNKRDNANRDVQTRWRGTSAGAKLRTTLDPSVASVINDFRNPITSC